ncbi:MAG: hypothetical protein IPO91_00900 [Chloroflexi bacterium]|nr:hypothetical protein [Chloroflexota bacterium]
MTLRKSTTRVLLSLVVVILLSGVFATTAQDLPQGGRIVVADGASNVSLDPFVTSWHSWPHYALYSTLFARDETMNYVGFLADTWEIGDDGLSLTINLIETAMFTDGTPVNAEAIKYNLDKYANPDTGASQGADLIGLLLSTEVVDEYTLKLTLASSFAPLFYVLSGLEIVSPTAYEALGPENFGTAPVGAGPFMLKELNTNNYVLFERNPDFNYAPPELYDNPGPVPADELQILFLDEDQTIISALETGEVTVAGVPTQNLPDVEANPDITLDVAQLQELRYVGFNTSKAPWDNVELRRAFAYATDRDEVNALAYDGLAISVGQPLPPSIWGHNPELDANAIQYDPERASAMLDELGYVDVTGDGLRETPEGTAWSVPLAVSSSDEYMRIAQVIDAEWRAVGIPVEIQTMERSALIDLTTTGTHDLFLLGYGYSDPSILTYFFDPDRRGGSNRTWFVNDELTALLQAADSELDQTLRYEKVTAVGQFVMDQQPWIFLVAPPSLTGVRNELQNWVINPDLSFLYWNAHFGG